MQDNVFRPLFFQGRRAAFILAPSGGSIRVAQNAQNVAAGTGTTLAVSFSATVTAGSALHCFVANKDVASEAVTVSDNVNGAWPAAIDSVDDGTNLETVKSFSLPNSLAGTITVTATFSISTTLRAIWVAEILNAKLASPLDGHAAQVQAAPGSGTDAISSGNATNATQPGLVLALSMDNRTISPVAPAAGTGFTDLGSGWNLVSGDQARLESLRITSITAIAGTFTGTTGVAPTTLMAIYDQAGTPTADLTPLDVALAFQPPPPQPRPMAAVRYEMVAPVGALLAASLTSLGWQHAASASPVTPSRRVEISQPVGTGTFALAKVPHNATLPAAALGINRPALEASQPTGPLAPFVSTSIGWLIIGTGSPPPASRSVIVSDGAPSGSGFAATLTTLSWLTCDAPPKSSLVAPRAQQPDGGESPLRPFVSTSFGWGASTPLPLDLPLIVRTVSESSPVGTLFASLSSVGWQSNAQAPKAALVSARAHAPSAPDGPLTPFVSASTGWLSAELPARAVTPFAKRVEPSQAHVGNALLFGGAPWDSPAIARTLAPATRSQEASQPTGPLSPFVSLSTGWIVTPIPFDTPLVPRVVADSSPVGTLLTPQPFGWASSIDQARPAPIVPRRVDTAAPVGTPFAIALPSNGWLATDNPRTPLALLRSAPTDPVGNLLVLPALPNLTWLGTENPRTPYSVTRAVVVDPVGTKMALPGALGPYWFLDQAPRQSLLAARVAVTDPVGSLLATLSSLGWLSAFEPSRAPATRQVFAQPSDPFRALQFGGSPWATVDVQPGKAATARTPDPVSPVGTLISSSLSTIAWMQVELPARQPLLSRVVDSAAPVGSLLTPAGLSSLGWFRVAAQSVQPAAPRNQDQAGPGGPLQPFVSTSSGWQVVELSRPRTAQTASALPSDPLSALQFGGTPWATFETARQRATGSTQQSEFAPAGSAFSSLSSLGWQVNEARAPQIIFPTVSPSEPVGLFMPPPVLPGMGWNYVMELPPRWSFVSRPVPSEPVGSSFALAFTVAPIRRCSPIFDVSGSGRLSPIFKESNR